MTKAPRLLKAFLTAAILLIAPVQAHVEPLKIRLGYVVHLASILFAKDGIARNNGKTYVVDVIRHQASTTQIIALANGELDIALLGFTSLPLAIENARMDDLRAVVGELQERRIRCCNSRGRHGGRVDRFPSVARSINTSSSSRV